MIYRSFLIVILVLAASLRLYRIDNPIADWHSFRQADTASVTREYLKNGINLLTPRYHDLSNIQSGVENVSGYRMVEFPIVNGVHASFIQFFGLQDQHVFVERLFYVMYSLILLLAIIKIAEYFGGRSAAILAGLSFAILPFGVFYSRAILPDLPATTAITVAFAILLHWVRHSRFGYLILVGLLSSIALLIKPFTIFLFPVMIFAVFYESRIKLKMKCMIIPVLLIAALPLIWWRNWIAQFPDGIPASDWLFNQNNIRFSGAFFRWIFEDRILIRILGGYTLPFVLIGLLRNHRSWPTIMLWGVSLFGYLWIFAGGNVQHDYYQILLLPYISVLLGLGTAAVLNTSQTWIPLVFRSAVILVCFGLAIALSWYHVGGYFNVNHWEMTEAGKAADLLTEEDALVIAPNMGDTTLLFQTNRKGWPIGSAIEEKRQMGAMYYVTTNRDDEYNELLSTYSILDETDRYAILDLRSPKDDL